ncbi:MAG TPA: vWA domain-containing protein [Flavobacteriaceae bacterium]|nr:VWA domain-containing protein [Flavobacteriaceae bacterium]MCB9212307.1 VWA domain-containing protein [Alteromonas sp.]HPF12486.1 vWA domain-containing protein [Flavobacteriaceae bacterium]HQU22255.1 vWA domain-containing protein [Flavobacteriaceae bacterium]HQU65212.1 vWA domain-containing protein [Flavobacteriaceae bacterium]
MKTLKTFLIMACLLSIAACKANGEETPAMLDAPVPFDPPSKHSIRVALLLDTSNSMDGLIDQAKAQLWDIVNELSYAKCRHEQPNLEIALYEYGNDNLNSREGYIRKILGFTNDLDDVSKELFSLTTNGGSEYCGTVIQKSLNQLDWGHDSDDLKMIFIAGNEPFTQGNIDYRDAANNAKEKGVVVNTIFCGNYSHGIDTKWKDGALLTYGDYMAIDHNKETIYVASPYDDAILQLNIQLNGTYIPYGRYGKEKVAVQEAQDANAEEYSKANAVSRTVSKGSHFYKNSSWDLVDAESEANFDYDKLKEEELPKNLQGKTKTEIKAYVKSKKEERARIQKEIAELNKKRKDYVESQNKSTSNGLENAMIEALKKQAKKKSYTWD